MGRSPEASQHIPLSRAAGSQHASSSIIARRMSRKTLMKGKLAKFIRIAHAEAFWLQAFNSGNRSSTHKFLGEMTSTQLYPLQPSSQQQKSRNNPNACEMRKYHMFVKNKTKQLRHVPVYWNKKIVTTCGEVEKIKGQHFIKKGGDRKINSYLFAKSVFWRTRRDK